MNDIQYITLNSLLAPEVYTVYFTLLYLLCNGGSVDEEPAVLLPRPDEGPVRLLVQPHKGVRLMHPGECHEYVLVLWIRIQIRNNPKLLDTDSKLWVSNRHVQCLHFFRAWKNHQKSK
jgi:hypothetical protein